jgi:hypothetical protein
MNTENIDMHSVHGFIGSVSFIILAHVSEFIGSIDLQTTSYAVAILVGIDTLTGSPIKNIFIRFWNKLNGRQQ